LCYYLIIREAAANSAAKNYLTKVLGISAEMEADLSELNLLSGDILLCKISLDKQKQSPYTSTHRKQYLIKN